MINERTANNITCSNKKIKHNNDSLVFSSFTAASNTINCSTYPLKPILKYPGGKGRELKYILPLIPKTSKRFFEPFVGGGAAYFSMHNAKHYYINDISKELIATYEAAKFQDPDFLAALNNLNIDWKSLSSFNNTAFNLDIENINHLKMPVIVKKYSLENFFTDYLQKMFKQKQTYILKLKAKGKDITQENKSLLFETVLKSGYYAAIRKIYNQNRKNNKIKENTAFYYFIREFCYSSMFRFSKNGDFNVPYGGMSYNSKNFDKKLEYLNSDELNTRLKNTDIYNKDFQEFVNIFSFDENDFIFVDPPYDTEFSTYDENNFGKQDQIRLANFLKSTQAKWLLVIKDTDFIRSLYPKENKQIFYKEFNKNYSVSFMNRNNRNAIHLMITNYEV